MTPTTIRMMVSYILGTLKTLAQGTQRRVRPQALQVDDDLVRCRRNLPVALADGAQGG